MSGNYRDLIGYAQNPPDPHWPGNARLALQIVLAYEEGSERTVLNGDTESESFISEIVGGVPVRGMRNPQAESIYEYGSRVGFWRINRELTERGISATILANTQALEANPEVVAAIADSSHEVANHGHRWIDYQYQSEDLERDHMKNAVESQERLLGSRPVGWYTGRVSPNTRRLVVEHGGFLYDADSYADDIPYYEDVNGKPHLVIPYTLEANDMKWVSQGGSFSSGDQYFTYMKDTFDTLYGEGTTTPRLMSMGLHCRIVGRPGRFAALKRFLDYVQSKNNVWICTREQVARHWWATNPPIGYDPSTYPTTLSTTRA